jgi:hypothetical protein
MELNMLELEHVFHVSCYRMCGIILMG